MPWSFFNKTKTEEIRMTDLQYAKYLAELMTDDTLTEKLFCMRFTSIQKLRGMVSEFEEEGFLSELVEAVFCKKADFIMNANTKEAMEKILKPSTPRYSGGNFVAQGSYHIEEEELLIWSRTSLQGVLIPAGQKRFEELFEKYVRPLVDSQAA